MRSEKLLILMFDAVNCHYVIEQVNGIKRHKQNRCTFAGKHINTIAKYLAFLTLLYICLTQNGVLYFYDVFMLS